MTNIENNGTAVIIPYSDFFRLVVFDRDRKIVVLDRGYSTLKGAKIGFRNFAKHQNSAAAHQYGVWKRMEQHQIPQYPLLADLLEKLFFFPLYIGNNNQVGV